MLHYSCVLISERRYWGIWLILSSLFCSFRCFPWWGRRLQTFLSCFQENIRIHLFTRKRRSHLQTSFRTHQHRRTSFKRWEASCNRFKKISFWWIPSFSWSILWSRAVNRFPSHLEIHRGNGRTSKAPSQMARLKPNRTYQIWLRIIIRIA